MFIRNRLILNYILAGGVALSAATPAYAQTAKPAAREQVEQVQVPAQQPFIDTSIDARETREQFKNLLRNYPPGLSQVFKVDPSLMTNEAYLASYPAIAAYLKQHPEIARNPAYFLEHVYVTREAEYGEGRDAIRMWNNMMEGITVFFIVSLVLGALSWLLRTIIEHRRWSRVSKVQAEVNQKLFDRFSSNEDLLTYIQSPAGRRFLEGTPVVSSPQQVRPLGAPVSRILWSVQIGIVIAAGALGMLFISGRVIEEVAQPLFAIATIGISLGIGFIVSSAVSYGLSRSMGLIEPAPAGRADTESNG